MVEIFLLSSRGRTSLNLAIIMELIRRRWWLWGLVFLFSFLVPLDFKFKASFHLQSNFIYIMTVVNEAEFKRLFVLKTLPVSRRNLGRSFWFYCILFPGIVLTSGNIMGYLDRALSNSSMNIGPLGFLVFVSFYLLFLNILYLRFLPLKYGPVSLIIALPLLIMTIYAFLCFDKLYNRFYGSYFIWTVISGTIAFASLNFYHSCSGLKDSRFSSVKKSKRKPEKYRRISEKLIHGKQLYFFHPLIEIFTSMVVVCSFYIFVIISFNKFVFIKNDIIDIASQISFYMFLFGYLFLAGILVVSVKWINSMRAFSILPLSSKKIWFSMILVPAFSSFIYFLFFTAFISLFGISVEIPVKLCAALSLFILGIIPISYLLFLIFSPRNAHVLAVIIIFLFSGLLFGTKANSLDISIFFSILLSIAGAVGLWHALTKSSAPYRRKDGMSWFQG
jgi:hypothetical protein